MNLFLDPYTQAICRPSDFSPICWRVGSAPTFWLVNFFKGETMEFTILANHSRALKPQNSKKCKGLMALGDLFTWTTKPSFNVFYWSIPPIAARAMWVRAWFAFDGRKMERTDLFRFVIPVSSRQVGDPNRVGHQTIEIRVNDSSLTGRRALTLMKDIFEWQNAVVSVYMGTLVFHRCAKMVGVFWCCLPISRRPPKRVLVWIFCSPIRCSLLGIAKMRA